MIRLASMAGIVLLWLGIQTPAVGQPGYAGNWPPAAREPSTDRPRYTPWAGLPATEGQQAVEGAPSYRGRYGQRTWSNYSRAPDLSEDEFRRPARPSSSEERPPVPPQYAQVPGGAGWPGYGFTPYGSPSSLYGGSGYYGPVPFTGVPYGYGPGYGSGIGGLNPWFWGW